MKAIETKLAGCFLITPTIHHDDRGYFYEAWNHDKFGDEIGEDITFIQDNQAFSNYGVIRGLHFQNGYFAQAKLVRAITGSILDVVVDNRPFSPTYRDHVSFVLSGKNHSQLFVPRGCAHGYSVLEDDTLVQYKCDNSYNKDSEGGLNPLDPILNIDWGISDDDMVISGKDSSFSMLLPQ